MSHAPEVQEERPLVSTRAADIAVALLFLVASAVVIADSMRLGFNWRPNEGPAPGYFPFYIAVVMALASAVNLARAVALPPEGEATLTTRPGFMRMMAIFIPAVVYVAATTWIGIYVASAIYIAGFMIFFGRFALWKAAGVSLSIAAIAFMMFEVWFLVPLPKGPLEAAIGY